MTGPGGSRALPGLAEPDQELTTWQFGARKRGYGEDYARQRTGGIVRRAIEGITAVGASPATHQPRSSDARACCPGLGPS